MRLFIFFIICVIIQAPVIYAQPIPVDRIPRLQEITANLDKNFDNNNFIGNLKDKFSKISSFEYVSQRNTPQDKTYATLSWKEMGNNYYYDLSSIDHLANTEVRQIVAFDGKRTSTFNGGNGFIEIQNGEIPWIAPKVFPSPLDIYSFLEVDGKFMSLNDLNSTSSLWKNLSSRILYIGTQTLMDRNCIVVRFMGSFDQHIKQKADYDVYLDRQTFMPIGWQAFDSQKCLIEQLEVIDFKTTLGKTDNVSFIYPSHYRITQYQWPGIVTGPKGVVKYFKSVRDEYFNDVQINSLSTEDLQIDPEMAKSIVDVNSRVVIPIPK
jgi:hypothetical protein